MVRAGVPVGESAGAFLSLLILERGVLLLERMAAQTEGKSRSFLGTFGDKGSSHLPLAPGSRSRTEAQRGRKR